MKKIVVLLLVLAVLGGCREKDKQMEKISFKDRKWELNLDYSAGTGFEWIEVYRNYNVEVEKKESRSTNSDPKASGGRGVTHIEGTINEDGHGILIMKYARPWETGMFDYETFTIVCQNGRITEIREQSQSENQDYQFIYNDTDLGSLTMFLPKDWVYEPVSGEREVGLLIKPQDEERFIKITYDLDLMPPCDPSSMKITISGHEYHVWMVEGYIESIMLEPKNKMLVTQGATWPNDRLTDLIKILDTVRWE